MCVYPAFQRVLTVLPEQSSRHNTLEFSRTASSPINTIVLCLTLKHSTLAVVNISQQQLKKRTFLLMSTSSITNSQCSQSTQRIVREVTTALSKN